MADDEIREVTGGSPKAGANRSPIVLFEQDEHILMQRNGLNFDAFTPAQARYLASKLVHLAERIEQRNA